MAAKKEVHIYTDGACRGNPGPGGWGAILVCQGKEKELSGAEPETTNNRMELTAAIRGLEAIKSSCAVHLTTDSRYVKDGITQWMPNWKRNNWRKGGDGKGGKVKNADLWCALDEAVSMLRRRHQVTVDWHWVEGHSGHEGNERADALANRAIDEATRQRTSAARMDTIEDDPTDS